MSCVLGVLIVLPSAAFAAGGPAAPEPSCALVPGWAQSGPTRAYQAGNLFEYMDGNAEGYLIYGFRSMRGVTCRQGETSFVVDLSDMGDADSAYGIFSANRDPDVPVTPIGMSAQLTPRRAMFAKGNWYLEIAANPEGDYTGPLREFASALDRTVAGSTSLPPALAWFPSEKQQSLRLVPSSVLGLRLLKHNYVNIFDYKKAFVVTEETPAAATEVMKKLQARFGETAPVQIEEEAFTATDRYLGRLCVSRKGRYVLGFTNVAEGQDPVALAKTLAAKVQ